jgi:Spx/MgsR family transcriptional regulator
MENIIVYGIPNCDIIKKSLAWLNDHKLDFVFHDYKKEGITKSKLNDWCKQVGWEKLLNKKSTTWRNLSASVQAGVTSTPSAIKIMMENNSIIKRPVIELRDRVLVGFDEAAFSKYFLNN